jgi:hypothetical protein
MVSSDSERTISATARAPTPPSPLQESGGIASTPLVIPAVASAEASVQRDEAVPVVTGMVPGSEEVLVHISDILEGNTVGDTPANEDIVVDTDLSTGVTQIGHGGAAASADPDLVGVTFDSGIPNMEGTFAQDPTDDVFIENMADTHDSYDDVLAGTGEHVADAQTIDLEVTTSTTAHVSPTRSSN